jgi:hypothetical protein
MAAAVLAFATLAAGGLPAPAPPGGLADLLAVAVEYRAHKLIFTMTTKAHLVMLPSASVRTTLYEPPAGTPVALPPDTVAVLTVETDLPFGRRDVTRILLDPRTGAALQAERLTTAHDAARTVTRYLRGGVYSWRWRPATRAEERLAPESWSDRGERFTPFPDQLPQGAVVTDGYAILPLAEMARLDRPGAALRLYVPSYHSFLAVDFIPGGFEMRNLNIEEQTPSGVRVEDGPTLVRAVRVSARAVGGTGREKPHELGVLGFQGGVTLLVDARTGVPLVLTGRADYIGTITAKLVRARLAYDPAAGARASAAHAPR